MSGPGKWIVVKFSEDEMLINCATIDQTLNDDGGNFLLLNARRAEPRYRIPPSKLRRRLDHHKARNMLVADLNVCEEGKNLSSLTSPSGFDLATAHFADGTESSARLLVGDNGNNSMTRRCLFEGGT
ncbi:hypothetical protein DSL72_001051 [Monilinia vaccinii-corymbosi]|uniref:Uncharacterized protein n=1 Tax=Monilinia vaccinii-corymbosi TaxID=61207 RepID=A0A8A3P6U7_9HELO|nr:hypothetical protein DSL72_001051 [Monilinia vaccinii-corymbosi]